MLQVPDAAQCPVQADDGMAQPPRPLLPGECQIAITNASQAGVALVPQLSVRREEPYAVANVAPSLH